MRANEFIAEGRGIAAREPGQIFRKSKVDYITFQGNIYFPEDAGAYEQHDQLLEVLDQWQSEFEGTLEMFGSQSARSKAAMISIWTDATGRPVAYGKWLNKSKKAVPMYSSVRKASMTSPNISSRKTTSIPFDEQKKVTWKNSRKPLVQT